MLHAGIYEVVYEGVVDCIYAARSGLQQTSASHYGIEFQGNAGLGEHAPHGVFAVSELFVYMGEYRYFGG